MVKKWFKKAVEAKPPYELSGWSKSLPERIRRKKALSSRPETMSLKTKYLSTARALQALANVTKDKETEKKARKDAKYFFDKAK